MRGGEFLAVRTYVGLGDYVGTHCGRPHGPLWQTCGPLGGGPASSGKATASRVPQDIWESLSTALNAGTLAEGTIDHVPGFAYLLAVEEEVGTQKWWTVKKLYVPLQDSNSRRFADPHQPIQKRRPGELR